MNIVKNKNIFTLFALALFVFLSDQFSKHIILQSMDFGDCCELAPFFNIVYFKNSGITFGMLRSLNIPTVLIIVSIIAIICMLVWVNRNMQFAIPVGLIAGGALGNVVDRIQHGSVVDFLDFHIASYHWPAFNVADCAIVIGVVFMYYSLHFEGKKQ